MKRVTRILMILAALVLVLANMSFVFADMDGRTDYDYTIRVYAGREGKFVDPSVGTVSDGGKTLTITKKAGEMVTVDQSTTGFVLNDGSEYYPRGFRIAGHDAGFSSNEVSNPTFTVDEDRSLEVAYGLKGGMVEYVVRYVDADGNDLRTSDTYYGMVGDRPVVSFKYVEGYQPRAFNLTGTLKESGNEWLFPYTKIEGTAADGNDGDDEDGNGGGNGNGAGAANAGGNGAGNGAGAAGGDNAGANGADVNGGGNDGPVDVIDIDDPQTPQAQNPDAVQPEENKASGVSPAVIGGGVAVIAAAAAAILLAKRRRKEEDAE